MGNAHPNIVPYQVFAVADGHVIVAVGNDGQFRRFADLLGVPALAEDERFSTNRARVQNRAVLVPLLEQRLLTMTRADLLAAMEGAGVPAGPINNIEDVFADPQVIARGMQMELETPQGDSVPTIRVPILMDGEPVLSRRAAPALDADAAAILSDPRWTA